MAMVVVDDSCLQANSQPKSAVSSPVGAKQPPTLRPSHVITWLGLRVGGCLALFYIHQMK